VLTPPRETPLPHMRHLLPALLQGLGVQWHAIVPIMAPQHYPEPGSLLRDGLMPAPPQLSFDFRELGAHALRHRPPHHLELALPGRPAEVCEAQKVEALGFPKAMRLPPLSCEATTLEQARLGWVQCQAKLGKALPQYLQELLGFLTLFEAHDDVINVPDETDLPQALPLAPSMSP